MPAFYKIDKERRLVMGIGLGVLTLVDSLAHQEKLLTDPDFERDFSQLMDVTHVTEVELSAEDIRRLALAKVFSDRSRRAILAKNDLQIGLARRFEMVRDGFSEKGMRVSRDLEEALEWGVLARPCLNVFKSIGR
jgi:hypothetical protein